MESKDFNEPNGKSKAARLFSALLVLTGFVLLIYVGLRQSGLLQFLILSSVVLAMLIAPFSVIIGAHALVSKQRAVAEFFSQYYLLFRELTRWIWPNDFGCTAIAVTNLAVLAVTEGRFIDARELLSEPGDLPMDQALRTSLLGQIHAFTGAADKARSSLIEARELVLSASQENPDQSHMEALAEFYSNECGLLPDLGDTESAIQLGLQGLQIREKFCGAESYDVAKTLNNLGYAYYKAKRFEEARSALERAIGITQKLSKESDYAAGNITNNLGSVMLELGEKDRASELLSRATKLPADGAFELGYRQYSIGKYYARTGHDLEAARHFSQAFKYWQHVQGLQHPDYVECVDLFAQSLQKLGKLREHKSVSDNLTKLRSGEHVPPRAMPAVK